MFACICHAVSVDDVVDAVVDGADTVDRIGEFTGAGTGCGTCHERLDDLLGEYGRCPLVALRSA